MTFRATGRSATLGLTLGALFDNYEAHVTPTKSASTRKHDKRALTTMRRYFGAQRLVVSLDRRDWDGFIRGRRAGRIRPAAVKEARSVKNRAIEQDLRLLLAVLNWGRVVRDPSGNRLLAE